MLTRRKKGATPKMKQPMPNMALPALGQMMNQYGNAPRNTVGGVGGGLLGSLGGQSPYG